MTKLSKRLSILYDQYPGDDAWQRFISNFPEVDYSDFSDFHISNDIVKAMIAAVGPINHSKKWLTSDVPALDHSKPIDVLKDKEHGERIIRCVLMRMP